MVLSGKLFAVSVVAGLVSVAGVTPAVAGKPQPGVLNAVCSSTADATVSLTWTGVDPDRLYVNLWAEPVAGQTDNVPLTAADGNAVTRQQRRTNSATFTSPENDRVYTHAVAYASYPQRDGSTIVLEATTPCPTPVA